MLELMVGGRQTADTAKAQAHDALTDARPRARRGAESSLPPGPRAVVALQRAAGNAAVNALVASRMRFPGAQAVADIDGALRALRRDEPAIDTVEKGLRALAEGGIDLPKSFDLKGIISFLASIFCLTWANIRNRIVKQIGDKAMGAVEKGVEIFQILSGPEGVGGLWQMLLTKLGNIKDMIFEKVKDFVQDRIITAGITWLIGLLNPVGAFIKACTHASMRSLR